MPSLYGCRRNITHPPLITVHTRLASDRAVLGSPCKDDKYFFRKLFDVSIIDKAINTKSLRESD